MIFNPNNYSVIFLSYDEPNCEENYKHLLTLCPKAQRVHGVKGSDTAHKEVAKLSKTENVIIVDGDNYVKPTFFTTTFVLDDRIYLNSSVLSYSATNEINGCVYGNGGIKVWPVSLLETMQTHENSTVDGSIDFDLNNYLQLNTSGSDLFITSSPLQAWRAGFREGVKLSMENKKVVSSLDQINWRNFDRLYRWMHVGIDITNGLWAIYGARLGCYMAINKTFDINHLKDFDYLNNMFTNNIWPDENIIERESNKLGELLNDSRITDVFSVSESIKYRNIPSILRSEENFIKYKYHPPYDIVYISNGEPNSEKNYMLLSERFKNVKRTSNILEAASVCISDYFWIVDNDAIILEDFDFIYNFDFFGPLTNKTFLAKNIKTNEISTTGALKLLPRMTVLRQETIEEESVVIVTNYTEKK